MRTPRIQRLYDIVDSVFDRVSGVDATEWYGQFCEDAESRAKFRASCSQIDSNDIDSLGFDEPERLSDREFEVSELVYEIIESEGLLPHTGRTSNTKRELLDGSTASSIEALCCACIVDDVETVRDLIKRIGSNVIDQHGSTPLVYAVGNNSIQSADLLLQNGGDPNMLDCRLDSAMHIGAESICSYELFKAMVKVGGRLDIRNANGQTPKDILLGNGREHWLNS